MTKKPLQICFKSTSANTGTIEKVCKDGGSAEPPNPKRKEKKMFEFSEIVALYVDVISVALPFTITFWLCDFVVCTILKAAFGGRFDFKSWR